MIARGFKSVIWVAAVGSAAIGCYMVSLQVATERAELTRVEGQIIAAKREIRSLQTELGTRGRMSQLEHWNAEVLALSTPTASQFLPNEMTLARFEQHEPTLDERGAEVRMAAAETGSAAPEAPVVRAVAPAPAGQPVVTRASFTPGAPQIVAANPQASPAKAEPKPAKADAKPVKVADAKAATAKLAAGLKPADTKKPEAKAAEVKTAEAKKPHAKKPDAKNAATAVAAVPAEKPRASKIDSKLASALKAPAKKAEGSGGN
jgi:hypothetical protein